MHNHHDQRAKRLLRGFFAPYGTLSTEEEVSPDAQQFDSYFVPGPDFPARRDDLLFKFGRQAAAFEVFSEAPDGDQLVECVRKLLNARHVFPLQTPPKPKPRVWILCAGKPDKGLKEVGAQEQRAISPGVYQLARAFWTSIVVLSELPETPATLMLRLMARGQTLKRALAELRRLPPKARRRKLAARILVELRVEIAKDPQRSPEDEEFVMETADIVEQIKNEGRLEGRREGRNVARREMLLKLYAARFGEVPPEVREAVRHNRSRAALLEWGPIFALKTASEIAATVAAPKRN